METDLLFLLVPKKRILSSFRSSPGDGIEAESPKREKII